LADAETFDTVVDWVASGALRRDVARRLGVPLSEWSRWLRLYATPEHRATLDRAARMGASLYAEETIEIADHAVGLLADALTATRMRISTRQWLAERMNREQFGAANANSTTNTQNIQVNIGQLHLSALLEFAPSIQDDVRARGIRQDAAAQEPIAVVPPPVPTLLTPPAASLRDLL